MINDRIFKIIAYLLNVETLVTYEDLSKIFMVSVATIRSDINQVDRVVGDYDVELIKKRGVGVKIQGSAKNKNMLKNMLLSIDTNCNKGSNTDRINNLAYMLIENKNEYMTIENLANALYVSRTTVQNDLYELKEWLKNEEIEIEIKKKRGVKVSGNEKALRSVLSRVFLAQTRILSPYASQSYYQPIQRRILSMLHINPDYIYQELKIYEQKLDYFFTEESFNNIVIHIAIAIKRVLGGNAIDYKGKMDIEGYEKEFDAASKLYDNIGAYYHLRFSKSEKYLVFLNLISARLMTNKTKIENSTLPNECDYARFIGEEIIRLIENTKQVEIDCNNCLENLIIHLGPTINRLQREVNLKNPLLEEIKCEYSDAYGIAWMTNSIFRKYIGRDISEDEAGFIAIHIQAMIEDSKEHTRVVLVCNHGIGISQLLATRLKNRFYKLQILSVESVSSFYRNHFRYDTDLIITTVPLKTDLPVIIVSPLLVENDIKEIENYIFRNSDGINELWNDVHVISLIHPNFNSQEEVVKEVHKILNKKKYVKDNFGEAIMEREAVNSTYIGNNSALPHAAFNSVNESTIVIVTLDHCICWKDDPVDLIMFIVLTKKDSTRLIKKLRKVFYKLYSDETHKQLVSALTQEKLINILQK